MERERDESGGEREKVGTPTDGRRRSDPSPAIRVHLLEVGLER